MPKLFSYNTYIFTTEGWDLCFSAHARDRKDAHRMLQDHLWDTQGEQPTLSQVKQEWVCYRVAGEI